jgi:hypothetical protein
MKLLQLSPVLLLAIALSANASNFGDRDTLTATLDSGFEVALANAEETAASAQADLDAAQADLDAAQAELADAQANNGDVAAAQAKVDAAQAKVDAAESDLDAANTGVTDAQANIGGAGALVEQMSDEQVTALNRSLNNAAHNGLGPLAFDVALLQRIIDEDLDQHEIQALTQGLELAARFEKNADRFDAKGDSGHADQMRARGEALQAKFFARVDDATADAAAEAARETARGVAKQAAKEAAREAAKEARGHGKP